MPRLDGWVGALLLSFGLAGLPLSGAAAEDPGSDLYDCGNRICGDWAPRGKDTCRSCKTAQCRTQNGGEVLAGHKTETECYEGHGTPPSDGPGEAEEE